MKHFSKWKLGVWHGVASIISALYILPIFWMLANSLRRPGLPPPRSIEWLPNPAAWSNYPRLLELMPFGRYAFNSTVVAFGGVALTLLTASWAGFALAQFSQRWRRRWVGASIGLLVVPITALWLPRLVIYRYFNLLDGYGSLIAPAVMGTSPLFILLFYWAARRIPLEHFEAARLEGASAWQVWWQVMVPLSRATLLAVGTLAFVIYWGDFITPLLYLKSEELYTLPIALQQLYEMNHSNWPLMMAGAVLITFPPVVLFAIAQRYLLRDDLFAGFYER